MVRKYLLGIACWILILANPPAVADDKAEIELLKKQLEMQAETIEALRSRLEAVESRQETQAEEVQAVKETAATTSSKPAVTSDYPMDIYGYLKLDAAFDTGGANNGNYLRWVDPDGVGRDDDQFSVTARQTRLGLKMQGPSLYGANTEGKIEMDFYGGGAENNAQIRMRHAYFTMEWPDRDLELLFGQTWDLMSPLVPRLVNFTNLWWTGNIGFRRAQARVTKGFAVGDEGRFAVALAATRNIGDPDLFAFGEDTGADAGFPTLQGRLFYEFPGSAGRETTLGLSGHYGEEEYDFVGFWGGRHDEDVKSWSVNLDAEIPIGKYLLFKSELFTGANLDAYVGGIGQGVVVRPFDDGSFRSVQAIRSHGGWVNLHIIPGGRWRYSVGGGFEDPDDGDLLPGARSRNMGVFANAGFFLRENIELMAELAHWRTDYYRGDDVENTRLQTAVRFSF